MSETCNKMLLFIFTLKNKYSSLGWGGNDPDMSSVPLIDSSPFSYDH